MRLSSLNRINGLDSINKPQTIKGFDTIKEALELQKKLLE